MSTEAPMNQDTITLTVDGEQIQAPAGRSLAAVLMLQAGQIAWRRTRFEQEPRGLFCGIGICFDCLVSVDGSAPMRACLLPAADGMQVQILDAGSTYDGAAHPGSDVHDGAAHPGSGTHDGAAHPDPGGVR